MVWGGEWVRSCFAKGWEWVGSCFGIPGADLAHSEGAGTTAPRRPNWHVPWPRMALPAALHSQSRTCSRASVEESAPTGSWFFPLYWVGRDTCKGAAEQAEGLLRTQAIIQHAQT